MSPELDKLLCEKYPKIFRDRHADMRTTAMCWGFDIGDGWFNIIDLMCGQMQHHIDWREKTRQNAIEYNEMLAQAIAGDHTAIDEYVKLYREELREREKTRIITENKPRDVPDSIPQVVATQVKEKFGTLRFYYEGGDEYCYGIECMADAMSARTCEECGSPGKIRHGGWLRTLCDHHATEMGYSLDSVGEGDEEAEQA